MKVLFLHGWQSVPGGVKPTFLVQHGHEVINPKLPDEDFEEAVRIAQAEFDKHQPNVVVGSSRGGAVAMNINSGDARLVLLCPAWKKYGTERTVKPSTVILHARADDVIAFADSEELVRNSGLPASTLIEVGSDHRLADPEPLAVMEAVVRSFSPPASFSDRHPYAYHVLPLHALKLIASSGRLLSKADLLTARIDLRRSSTADVDEALGLSQFVHFYLPEDKQLRFDCLPILDTQLKESAVLPFPHTVLVISTSGLSDAQCGICNFNAAVSRPAYPTVKGGNHTRGTAPEKILRHWQGFRSDAPNPQRLRFSHWHKGVAVPLMLGHQITLAPLRVGYKTKAAELLLRSPFEIPVSAKLSVFSDADLASVRLLNLGFEVKVHRSDQFEWYSGEDRVEPHLRATVNNYFQAEDGQLPDLDFDRLRPSPKSTRRRSSTR
jgi:Alpha/beta hydrolase family